MEKNTFYVTTPIYYVNSEPHIGSAYTTIVADIIARYKRFCSYEVYFLTGTDEHGQKILETAQKKGVEPQVFCDVLAGKFRTLWKDLEITHNDFIRTTEKRHEEVVQNFVKKLFDSGSIYKGNYEGWYCVHDEAFWGEADLLNHEEKRCCPTCKREVRWLTEQNYFFKLSAFQERLKAHYEAHPDFVEPDFRRNEMLNILNGGLKDLSISRTSFSWGIPIPEDPKHVIYVWVDALINYVSALGYSTKNDGLFHTFWPADLHLIGKEINRFHSIIWPAMLMAADLPLPKKIFAHGWLTVNGEKISKSAGNAIDPRLLMNAYGRDAVKYYLLRDINFGKDGDFSEDNLIGRINADLANDLGNLLHRTAAMGIQNFDGHIDVTPEEPEEPCDLELKKFFETTKGSFIEKMEHYQFTQALEALWSFIGFSNKYIDLTEPWKLTKTAQQKNRLKRILWNLSEALRNIALFIKPVMFETSLRIYQRLGLSQNQWEIARIDQLQWNTTGSFSLQEGEPLFPRIDVKEFKKVIQMCVPEEKKNPVPATENKLVEEAAATAVGKAVEKSVDTVAKATADTVGKFADNVVLISYDHFRTVQLRTAKVLQAKKVEKSKKLMQLSVDVGEALPRQIVAGISQHYEPQDLVGRTIIVVANLEPAKLMGLESHGMLLAAKDGEHLRLLTVDGEIKPGAVVS